eukprot:scaffold531286_cov24-Prasinocladus_malaysianus.AAC.1
MQNAENVSQQFLFSVVGDMKAWIWHAVLQQLMGKGYLRHERLSLRLSSIGMLNIKPIAPSLVSHSGKSWQAQNCPTVDRTYLNRQNVTASMEPLFSHAL